MYAFWVGRAAFTNRRRKKRDLFSRHDKVGAAEGVLRPTTGGGEGIFGRGVAAGKRHRKDRPGINVLEPGGNPKLVVVEFEAPVLLANAEVFFDAAYECHRALFRRIVRAGKREREREKEQM